MRNLSLALAFVFLLSLAPAQAADVLYKPKKEKAFSTRAQTAGTHAKPFSLPRGKTSPRGSFGKTSRTPRSPFTHTGSRARAPKSSVTTPKPKGRGKGKGASAFGPQPI